MRTYRRSLALLLVLSFPAFLFAHDHHRLTGIITRVDSKDMDIKSTDGKVVTILLRSVTEYFKGKAKGTASDLTIGTRVEVSVVNEGGRLVAHVVRIDTASASRDAQKP